MVGPHDPLRLLVAEDGQYKLLLYAKALEEGTVQSPIIHSSIPILEKLEDAQWIICPGVKAYSSFTGSIGFDIKAAVEVSWPPDTAQHSECSICYTKSPTRKSQLCEKCTALKWQLSARKRVHDHLTPAQRKLRQQASSTVPFDILSPASKKAWLSNMRAEITKLRTLSQHSFDKLEQVCINDKQNDELCELVKAIDSCDQGRQPLQGIFQEADEVGKGKGDLLKDIWERDISDMKGFNQDQQRNGRSIIIIQNLQNGYFYQLKSDMHDPILYLSAVTGRLSNLWATITIQLAWAIFSRSPAAYHAVRSMGLLQLPCDKTLRGYMYKHACSPGISEESLLASRYYPFLFVSHYALQMPLKLRPPHPGSRHRHLGRHR